MAEFNPFFFFLTFNVLKLDQVFICGTLLSLFVACVLLTLGSRDSVSLLPFNLFNSVCRIFFFWNKRDTILTKLSPLLINNLIIFDCLPPCADIVLSDSNMNNKGEHSKIITLLVCRFRFEETDCSIKSLLDALHTFICYRFAVKG